MVSVLHIFFSCVTSVIASRAVRLTQLSKHVLQRIFFEIEKHVTTGTGHFVCATTQGPPLGGKPRALLFFDVIVMYVKLCQEIQKRNRYNLIKV